MVKKGTFVFLDLETTDHPRQTTVLTKITEMSLVAANIQDIIDSESGVLPPHDKLTKCFNPFRLVQPGVTGLTNELLEDENEFDSLAVHTMNMFLGTLSKPIILIAHNGEVYDFPILQKYFKRLKVSLDDNVYCADSLKFFKHVYDDATINLDTTWDYAPSLKLSSIYKRFFQEIENGLTAHEAESDCIMLMKIVGYKGKDYRNNEEEIVNISTEFVEWVKGNSKKFKNVKPVCSLTRQIFES